MLDSWTPEATVTVGGVLASIVGLLILIVRKMGARTDPELLKLTNRQLGLFESLEKNLERHSQILTTLTETITRHSESDAQRSVQITQALNLVIEKARGEHEEMKQTLGAVLQAATEGHSIVNETRVIAGDIMDKLPRLDQTDLLKQIADKLDTVLKNIELMRGEFTQRVEQIEEEVETIKTNVKRATQETPKVNEVSTVDLPVIKEPEEKDDNNV